MEALSDPILHMPVSEIAGISYDCSCGRHHSVTIGSLIVERGASRRIGEVARQCIGERTGRVMVVADCHTYPLLGQSVEETLKAAGLDAFSYVFHAEHLHPDAATLGTLLIEASETPLALMVAVGSGTLNDITRFISHRLGVPYIIVGTAPSMDGYCGNSSPIICRDNKISFNGHCPSALLLDTEVLAKAPQTMISAGFGDVIGKYIALTDWKLGRDIGGEYYCPVVAQLMADAVQGCVAAIDGVVSRSPEDMGRLASALCLAGMCMSLVGVTRPASGCEHAMTHCIDLDKLRRGQDYPLHGNTVGMAAIVMARVYELAVADGLVSYKVPSQETIRGLISRVGGPIHPRELDIDRDTFRHLLMIAGDLRPRYTILKYADEQGRLERYADIVTEEYYGR